ncbi:hypothetical protein ACVWY2_009875 [Bradyrhizobium sp. JR6.1]
MTLRAPSEIAGGDRLETRARPGRPHPYITELRGPRAAISMNPTNATAEGKPMWRSVGCVLLLLATTSAAIAEPSRFSCDAPRGKRVEVGPSGKGSDVQWIDDDLDTVRPSVVIDGETFSVTWGTSVATEGKAAKLTTYVFAAAHRTAASIFATRVDESTAEIFRFYFGNKSLYKLTSRLGGPSPDAKAAPFVATYLATCREQ